MQVVGPRQYRHRMTWKQLPSVSHLHVAHSRSQGEGCLYAAVGSVNYKCVSWSDLFVRGSGWGSRGME